MEHTHISLQMQMQVQVQVALALQLAPRSRLHSVDALHPLRFLSSVLGQWGAAGGNHRLLQCNASMQLQVARCKTAFRHA